MRLEHASKRFLEQEILKVLKKHLPVKEYAIFFFGSRVSGKGDERSDIDVGVEGAMPLPLEILARIREDFGNIPTMYRIDIADFSAASEEFKRFAKQNIERIDTAA